MNPTRVAQVFLCLVLMSVFTVGVNGCKSDDPAAPGTTVTPITDNLFPLTVGHMFTYKGYATAAGTGARIADPTDSYITFWTILTNAAPSPLGGTATAIKDSTRGPFGPGGFVVGVSRTLLIKKDSVLNDYFFMQSIGPFKRAFGVTVGTTARDTLIWVPVARGSQGVGSTGVQWTAFDSTFTGAASTQVRLQIFGVIEAQETITDSSTLHVQRSTYRSRTFRRITLGGSVVQDNVETSKLWLAKDIGPVQVRIVEDTENLGHFRAMQAKNF